MLSSVERNRESGAHSLVVSLDLRNAFGTAWGPSIVASMRNMKVGREYEKILKSFLLEREIETGGVDWTMEMGCPQGSSLGPILWLIVMEDWFHEMKKHELKGVDVQAYADDQLLVVSGTSVKKIEKTWEEVCLTCRSWARKNKLEYNVEKTIAMFISGGKEVRAPRIVMEEIRIEMSSNMKYLGIIIDKKRNWIDHMKYVRGKVKNISCKFMGVAGRRWGRKREVLKLIYERAVCSIILYGAAIWGARSKDTRIRKQLAATERPFLRAITGAYRTAPTAALAVIAGCVPLKVRARVEYEAHVIWNERLKGEKVSLGKRVHPAWRGWMAKMEDYDENKDFVRIWVDGVDRGNEGKGFGGIRCRNDIWETRTKKVEGNAGICELEELAVWEGMK